jgi:hypothetical protein
VAKNSADNSRMFEQCVHRCCDRRTLHWFDTPWYPRKAIANRDDTGRGEEPLQCRERLGGLLR